MPDGQAQDDKILHQTSVEGVIDDSIATEGITNASVAHSLNATFSNTEVQNALNALGTKINAILAAMP